MAVLKKLTNWSFKGRIKVGYKSFRLNDVVERLVDEFLDVVDCGIIKPVSKFEYLPAIEKRPSVNTSKNTNFK